MAHCKISSHDFIQNAFAPVIAVKCSALVNEACKKNNLSFIELLQPFSKLNVEAQMRDSTGNAVTIKNLRMNFLNVNDVPPQPIVARQFLNSSVITSSDLRISTITINECSLQIPSSIPWFEVWRETFLRVQHPSDHEFTKHFLACMFVVSSSEPNPLDALNQMLEEITQSEQLSNSHKWFNTNVLRYIVVLHDTMEGKTDTAIKLIETLKQQHGGHNCFLLQINSRSPGTVDENFLPDPWSQFLIKKTENLELSDSDSPRNLIDTSGVTSMPINVIHDSGSLGSHCISSSSNIIGEKLEIGQEVNEVNTFPSDFHPLTPDTENLDIVEKIEGDTFNVSNPNDWPTSGITSTIPHGACLTTNDVEQLKMLVNEFSLRSLIPYIEKQIQQLSDVISNKKGVSRSLFSATKRWFTPNKLGASGSVMQINTVTYASDSPEMQLRRLGDLYFMFGHYNMAFQIYHSAKRDFNADQAWPYYAGALEMAALSAFMSGEMTRKTCDYMEQSITTYLYTCKLPQFATRATLLSTECLKDKGQYGEAAHQFIRMTSEDSDLGSALLLEQAAYCFLFCNKPKMVRKYAFHTVLSGHRFSKSMQRKHALRCYRQAFQIFKNKGWSLAEDHIYYTIGRQALFVKEIEEANDSFSKLLSPKSRQNAQQQAIFLKEYLYSFNLLMKKSEDDLTLPVLSLFTLKGNETKVLLGPQLPLKIPGRISASGVTFSSDEDDETNGKWHKLEQILVQEAFGPFGPESMIFKPMISLFSNKNIGSTQPVAIMSEPIQILVTVHNTLQILLHLKDIYLLWEFTETGETKTFNNECIAERKLYNYIRTHKLDSITLAPNSEEKLVLAITPLAVGKISIKGICYTLINAQDTTMTVTGKQEFNIHGPKLAVKEKNSRETYNEDNRLNIIIVPSASCLQVSFNELNQELLCNELQNISIEVRNCGSVPLHKIMMASSSPHLFSTTFPETETDDANFENSKTKENRKHLIPFALPSQFNGKLEPGQSYTMNLWFRAPSTQGSSVVDLLFYYENFNSELIPKYRLVKHNWHLSVQSSLLTSMNTRKSKDCCEADTLTFSLKATNCNQIHHAAVSEITLVQVSLVSPNWKLHKNVIISSDVKLQTQESVHFLLKATKCKNPISDAHYTNLMLSMHMKVYPEMKHPSINFAKRILKDVCSNTINSNYGTIDSILILAWHAIVTDSAGNKRNVIGQNFIPVDKSFKIESSKKPTNHFVSRNDLALTTTSSDHRAISALHQNITYNLAHLPLLVHNFKENKICTVPMQLILHSNADTSLIIKVNTISSSSETIPFVLGNEIFSTNSSNCFRSIGRNDFQCILEPSSSFKVRMMMAVTAPGTYELGDRIKIYCRTSSHTNFLVCKVQSVLIVKSTNIT